MAHHRCGQTLSCQLPFDIFVVTGEMVDSSHSIENGLSNVCDVVHGATLGDPGRCRHLRAAFLTPMITGANISTAPWSSLRWSDLFITSKDKAVHRGPRGRGSAWGWARRCGV